MAREEAEIKELTKKLAQNPDSLVFAPLADAHRRIGQHEEAIRICREGLEKNPTYMTARVILGRALMDTGELDEAASEFKKIESADPQNIMAHSMMGQIAMKQGHYPIAIEAFQKVLALTPDDASAQSMLDEALANANKGGGAAASPASEPAPASGGGEQLGSIKVADIYLKKGALDEAEEVVREILASDPDNPIAKQKLQEIQRRRGPSKEDLEKEAAQKKMEEKAAANAKATAAEEARKKIEEARKRAEEEKAKAEKARQAADEAKRKAEEAKRLAAEEADKKKKAEEEAKQKAAAEAKRKAEEEARKKAEEEAKRKAEEEAKRRAEEEAKQKAAAEAKRKAEEEAKKKAEEEAKKKAAEEASKKKEGKLSSEDILSVMQAGTDDEIIEEEPSGKPASAGAAPAAAVGSDLEKTLKAFNENSAIEGTLFVSREGKVLVSMMDVKDMASTGQTASKIFQNTEKAVGNMQLGKVEQIMIAGEDGRQILFVTLKQGVLMAITSSSSNIGLLRLAINDLKKKAA